MVGVEPAPKKMPVPTINDGPSVFGISMPCLHFSASNNKSKQPSNRKETYLSYHKLLFFSKVILPVPIFGNFPIIIFSDTPRIGSVSA